jgi:hypothetical protein
MRKSWSLLLVVLILVTSCSPKRASFRASSLFGFGTNATLNVQGDLPAGGYYLFLLKFHGVDRPRFRQEKWPVEMRTNLRLLVKTNGQTVLSTNISTLRFDYISDERKELVYHIDGISLPERVKVECVLEDLSVGLKHPAEFVFVRAMPK